MKGTWSAEIHEDAYGETFGDLSAGGQIIVVWTNPEYPCAVIESAYGVCRVEELEGEYQNADTLAYPFYVAEQTEYIIGSDPDSVYDSEVWQHTEPGEGSYRGYETQAEAMQCARNMAKREAGMGLWFDWDGTPQD